MQAIHRPSRRWLEVSARAHLFPIHTDPPHRVIGASREQTRRERDAEDGENGYAGSRIDDDDDDML